MNNQKVNWTLKKISTHLMEGLELVAEYWMVGVLHEVARTTKYFNGNVNTPHVGTFITLSFTLFYLARVFGSVISLKFADSRRFVFVTYLLAIPAIIFTFMIGWYKSAFWIVMVRTIVGFCTSFGPVMCMLRAEISKGQLVYNFGELKKGNIKKEDVGKISGVSLTLLESVEFLCSFGIMLASAFFYTAYGNGGSWLAGFLSVVMVVFFLMFMLNFGFTEPQVLYYPVPLLTDLESRRERDHPQNRGQHQREKPEEPAKRDHEVVQVLLL